MKRYQAGDKFPNLIFQTAYQSDIQTRDILKGKTVFWVLRYIGCPICRLDVSMIAERYKEFEDKNAQVFVVMQSDREHIRESLGEEQLPFEIICDVDMKFYDALNIAPASTVEELLGSRKDELEEKIAQAENSGFYHGDYEGEEQQLPAMFIVDEEGQISYAHYAKDLMDMPKIDDVLKML